nr:NHLP bacteriocin system secretion protein [Planctomycetota bacterium]
MEIFRKTSLERLRSPEQLDEPLRVIGRKESVALLGLGVLVALGLLWGVLGSMPDSGHGEGVLIA